MNKTAAWAGLLWLLSISFQAHPSERKQNPLKIRLPNGIEFEFAREDSFLLGLKSAGLSGVSILGKDNLSLPVVADEWGSHRIYPFFILKKWARTKNGSGFEIHLQLMGDSSLALWNRFFVLSSGLEDSSKISGYSELKAAERKVIQGVLDRHPELSQQTIKQRKIEDSVINRLSLRQKILLERKLKEDWGKLNRILWAMARKDSFLRADQGALSELRAEKKNFYENWFRHSCLLRDEHRFAIPEVSNLATKASALSILLHEHKSRLKKGGLLVWEIDTCSGRSLSFPGAVGFRQRFRFELEDSVQTNVIRVYSTQAIGGSVKGATAINFRYRGLGRIEHPLSEPPFATFDLWPASYRKHKSVRLKPEYGSDNSNRYEFLSQRHGVNLITMPRGGGISAFDLLVKGNFALVSWSEKPGDIRGLLEIYPGDTVLSSLEEFWFTQTRVKTTPFQSFLLVRQAQVGELPHLFRTLWFKVDKALRQLHATDLGYQTKPVKPAVGMNWDMHKTSVSFARAADELRKFVPVLKEQGVEIILNHTSGWKNGQTSKLGIDGDDTTAFAGGGSCNVYDYKPVPMLSFPWKRLHDSLQKAGIDYLVWITAMVKKEGDFALRIRPESWALNSPDGIPNLTYGEDMVKFNGNSQEIRELLRSRLLESDRNEGFEGFWLDSWHNLWLSELDWSGRRGTPMQRIWLEEMAWWSRKGKTMVGEGLFQPGLSCSIETEDWEKQPWYFGNTLKWLRNGEHKKYTKPELKAMAFKFMACGGWVLFDILEYGTDGPYTTPDSILPGFSRLAKLQNRLRPQMQELEFLPQEKGVRWKGTHKEIIFGFKPESKEFPEEGFKVIFKDGDFFIAEKGG